MDNRNTGYKNTGYSNTGDWNTGDWNTGHWNTCNYETGFFCTEQSDMVRVFNSPMDREQWDDWEKPDCLYFNITEWVVELDMTDQEKIDNPTFHTTGGYLKSYEYQEAFQKSWDAASEEDRKKVEALPNFDADIFLEISGIDVRKSNNPQEIIIDGATYVLKS